MATKRQVLLEINVGNLNSIEQLDNYLDQVNNELRSMDKNSDAFKELSAKARQADGALKTVEQSLEGVTSTQKAEGLLKLGEGFVGMFATVQGLSIAFGENNEKIEKVIAQVGGLIVALDGVKKVTEALSAENLKFVAGAVSGFKKAGIAAKLFGKTTRAALTATGILAFVALIGTIIANWDSLKKKGKDALDAIRNSTSGVLAPIRLFLDAIDTIVAKFGDLQNLAAGIGSFFKKVFTIDGTGLQGAIDAFNETIEMEKELDEIRDRYNEKITDTTKEFEKQQELLELQGGKEEEVLQNLEDRLTLERDILREIDEKNELTDEEKNRLEDVEFELKKIEIMQKKLNDEKIKANQLASENAKREKEAAEIREKREKEAAEIEAKRIIDEANERMKRYKAISDEVYLNEQLLEIDKERAKIQSDYFSGENLEPLYVSMEDVISKLSDSSIEILKKFVDDASNVGKSIIYDDDNNEAILERGRLIIKHGEEQVEVFGNLDRIIAKLAKKYDYIRDKNEENTKLIEKATNESEVLLETERKISEIYNDQNISKFEQQNRIKKIEEAEISYLQRVADNISNVLNLLSQEDKLKLNLLEADKSELATRLSILKMKESELKVKIKNTKVTIENTEDLQKRLEYENELLLLQKQEIELSQEYEKIEENIKDILIEVAENASKPLEIQKTQLENLQEFLAEYQEEIMASQQLIQSAFDLESTLRENQIQREREALDEWLDQNLDAIDRIRDEKEDLSNREEELNELLKDAEGERYDQIMMELESIRTRKELNAEREKVLENERIKRENSIIKGEYEAEKAKKRAAVIQSVIQTILGTVEALPNLLLSGIVAAAGAAATIAIAAQKIPEPRYIPEIKEDGGLLKGPSHTQGGVPVIAEGGEYVMNKKSTNQFLPILEAMNAMKFAEGGQIPTNTNVNTTMPVEMIDYDRFADTIIKGLKDNPMFVSVVEFRDVENRLNVVERRSTL